MKKIFGFLAILITFNSFGQVPISRGANNSDAFLRDRQNHTGLQAISTISGLQLALDGFKTILDGTGLIRSTNGVITYDNNTYLTSISSTNVIDALGYMPYNANNPSNYITSSSVSSLYSKIASPTFTGTVSGITPVMVNLGNVNNISDINKPISTLQQNALDKKANSLNPIFSGDVEMDSIGNGVVIKSPNGTRFRITVSNSGNIISTSL